jgi:hypothetical protein
MLQDETQPETPPPQIGRARFTPTTRAKHQGWAVDFPAASGALAVTLITDSSNNLIKAAYAAHIAVRGSPFRSQRCYYYPPAPGLQVDRNAH